MIEGFWVIQFEGLYGKGGGIVVLTGGKVFGGNSGYTFTGKYEFANQTAKAEIRVEHFLPGVPNAWGTQGNFDLLLTGTVQGAIIKGMAAIQPQGLSIPVKLSRRAHLP